MCPGDPPTDPEADTILIQSVTCKQTQRACTCRRIYAGQQRTLRVPIELQNINQYYSSELACIHPPTGLLLDTICCQQVFPVFAEHEERSEAAPSTPVPSMLL